MKKLILSIPVGVPSIIMTAIVAYLSLSSHPLPQDLNFVLGYDKVCHALLYFVTTLVYTYDYAKKSYPHYTKINIELFIVAVAMLLGLAMESGQLISENMRAFEWGDIAANSFGAILAFIVQYVWLMKEFRKFMSRHHHHHHHQGQGQGQHHHHHHHQHQGQGQHHHHHTPSQG